jgi:hypothetical protein
MVHSPQAYRRRLAATNQPGLWVVTSPLQIKDQLLEQERFFEIPFL